MKITKRTLVPLRQSEQLASKRPDRAWAVFLPSDGSNRWARKYFRHKSDAEAFCATKRGEIIALGVKAKRLTDSVKREVLACLNMLDPIGKTLLEAVTWYSKHHKSLEQTVTVSHATDALLRRAKTDGLSKRHTSSILSVMSIFGRDFSQKQVAEITGDDIQSWLDRYKTKTGQPLSAVSHNSYRRYLGLFFSFCVKKGWLTTNPMAQVNQRKVFATPPRLITPSDLAVIFGASSGDLKTAIALQAFCGLRVAEMARLRWTDVLFSPTGCFIQVGADNAKTTRRRLTPIPEGLVHYLNGTRKTDGFVYASGRGKIDHLQRAEISLRRSLRRVSWGRNALRASALSYRLALTKDASATALEMGNSPTVLLRDYRELTTPATAGEWFAVSPDGYPPPILRIA
jgi:integrase